MEKFGTPQAAHQPPDLPPALFAANVGERGRLSCQS
jgi:hypothetical protein